MPDLNTATVTRDEARQRIDRLGKAIRAYSAASLDRGMSIHDTVIEYAEAADRDDRARAVTFAELDILSELLLGLVEQRTVSATAMRLLAEDGAA